MGDAGPLTPPVLDIEGLVPEHETSSREVTVLVTGFGVRSPFNFTSAATIIVFTKGYIAVEDR